MSIFDDLFGGTDNTAQNKTAVQNGAILQRTAELAERAREDAFRLFPSAQDALTNSANKAMNVNAQGADAQINAFTQGNQDAQRIQALGLGAFRDAIMGNQQDFSPQNLLQGVSAPINVDTGFLQQTAPQIAGPQALGLTSDPNYGGGFLLGNAPAAPVSNPSNTPAAPTGTPAAPAAPAPVPFVAQDQSINDLVNQYLSGGISEKEGAQQLIQQANAQGMDLGQLSSILGLTPADILRVSGTNNATLNNTGDAQGIAAQTNTPRDYSQVNPDGPGGAPVPYGDKPYAYSDFAPIVRDFESGDTTLEEGTRKAIGLANQLGLSAAQLGAKLGLPEADVLRLAAQFGLSI